MGSTLVMYSSTGMLKDCVIFKTRTHRNPTSEQTIMCHSVNAIGNGKPANAKSHLLNKMTEMDTLIHNTTYEYAFTASLATRKETMVVTSANRRNKEHFHAIVSYANTRHPDHPERMLTPIERGKYK